jgi:uncharacterized protein
MKRAADTMQRVSRRIPVLLAGVCALGAGVAVHAQQAAGDAEKPAPKQVLPGPVAHAPLPATVVSAAKAGDSGTALALISQKADVNAPEDDGTTALQWAVYHNDVPVIDALLKAGAKANTINQYGSSPLAEAAITGNVEVIGKLLKAGADPDAANADGQTPLMVIARTSNVPAAEELVRHGAKVNALEQWHGQTALMWAAAEKQAQMVRFLIKHGANVNARSKTMNWQRMVTAEPRAQGRLPGGLTPLLYAAREGCLDCVKALVEAKADINLPDPEGVTPLIVSIINFHFDTANYLLDNKANPNTWDWWGRTPLYCAVDLNTIPHGGRPDMPSLDQTTSLQIIEKLLNLGANPDAQLKLFPPYRALGPDRGADMMLTIGATPLLRAAKAGDVPAIKLLLAHHADVELPNIYGMTPLMAAAGIGSNEIDTRGSFKTQAEAIAAIDVLVAAGADVNKHEPRNGQTALHAAALFGWNDVIKDLVGHHADLRAQDAKGKTPLDSAMGRAGGHGRGGTTIEVHEATGQLIEQLLANPPQARVDPPRT